MFDRHVVHEAARNRGLVISPGASRAATTLLLAKNRGLSEQIARAVGERPLPTGARYDVRGEDVPYLSDTLARAGRSVVAYTGDDLVDEWLAAGNAFDQRVRRSAIPWLDPNAIFKKPALCLIGPPGARLPGSNANPTTVAICARYRNLANRFLDECDPTAETTKRIEIQGALESVCLQGLADFIIDIVVTGRTMRAAGLAVREVLCTSDLAVLETQ